MKVIFEFDTDSENFDNTELEAHYQSRSMAMCLNEIQNKLRGWYKYDERGLIPVDEICDSINDIILENVNMERLGY